MAQDKPQRRPKAEVILYSYPKLLFAWPLVAFGFFMAPFGGLDFEWAQGSAIGWAYLFTILIVIMTIGIDLERNHSVFWIVLVLLLMFVGMWLGSKFEVPVFKQIGEAFAELGVEYNWGFGLSLSILLAIPFVVMVLWSRLSHKWRITHNEFESYSFGRADDSLARGAKRVRSTYPDLLELLLCGAGTLIVYSATGRTELRRIRHVPMLPLKRRAINRILETTSVTTSDEIIEEEFDDEGDGPEEDYGEQEVGGNGGGGEIGGERL